jgi:hypothetical protein
MEHGMAVAAHDVAAIIAVRVVEVARAPMVCGGVDDLQAAVAPFVPDAHFHDLAEIEGAHELRGPARHHHPVARVDEFERAFVQVVEMGVGDEHGVDRRKVVERDAGHARAFDDAVPKRPVRIDDDIGGGELDEESGVADPGDPRGAGRRREKSGRSISPSRLRKIPGTI